MPARLVANDSRCSRRSNGRVRADPHPDIVTDAPAPSATALAEGRLLIVRSLRPTLTRLSCAPSGSSTTRDPPRCHRPTSSCRPHWHRLPTPRTSESQSLPNSSRASPPTPALAPVPAPSPWGQGASVPSDGATLTARAGRQRGQRAHDVAVARGPRRRWIAQFTRPRSKR
jgi:hypothetical protein